MESWCERIREDDDHECQRIIQNMVGVHKYRQVNPYYVALLFDASCKPVIPELEPYCDLSRLRVRPCESKGTVPNVIDLSVNS